TVGQKIRLPYDDKISSAMRNLWKQDLFGDVSIYLEKIVDDKIFLEIKVVERPRLSKYNFRGISKTEGNELKDKLGLVKSRVVTEALRQEAINNIKRYYQEKGFSRTTATVVETRDSLGVNNIILTFTIQKGSKTKINNISIAGNQAINDAKLLRAFKSTKVMSKATLHPVGSENVYEPNLVKENEYWKNLNFLSPSKTLDQLKPYFNFALFNSSKFNEKKYQTDLDGVIALYNKAGYRDASIMADTIYSVENGHLNIDVKVNEGKRYYFGDIDFKGQTKYSSEYLSKILGIKKGDIYNQALLEQRLGKAANPEGTEDISSLYMDDGYLFFNVTPIEVAIVGDTIDYEIRITEGPQATNNRITIVGNDRTSEHVIRRELRTF